MAGLVPLRPPAGMAHRSQSRLHFNHQKRMTNNLSMGELARRTQAAAAALNGEIDPAARVLRDWIEEKIMRRGGSPTTDSQWQMIKDQAFEVLDHAFQAALTGDEVRREGIVRYLLSWGFRASTTHPGDTIEIEAQGKSRWIFVLDDGWCGEYYADDTKDFTVKAKLTTAQEAAAMENHSVAYSIAQTVIDQTPQNV